MIVKGGINQILFKLIHRKGFEQNDTIVICGSIRSGSTWLAEIVSSMEGHVQLFEPLHPEYVGDVKKIMPERNWFVESDRDWPEGQSFFNKVLSGKLVNPWILSQVPFAKMFGAKRLVVKFVRANLMLGWLARQPGVRMPILVMRHPCAIIASQLNKGWPPSKEILLGNRYFDAWPELKQKCQSLSKPEEIAALAWCLRYHAPLNSPAPQPFILVSYEALVRRGEQELRRIFDAWQMPLSEKSIASLNLPSDTSESDSFIVQGKDPLAGWKSKLTGEQINNILNVLNIFGLTFYSEALEPDYPSLSRFGFDTEVSHD